MYFSATLFALLSFRSPTLPALSIACTNFLFTILAFLLIDRIGRRRILLSTIPVMALALGVCAWAFGYIDIQKVHVEDTSVLWPAYLILTTLTVYVAGYATGLGPIPWFQSELFPLSVRALGSSLSTATNWSANFVVGISFLPALEILGARATFVVYAMICILGWVGVWWGFPEMGGVGLEGVKGVIEETLGKKRGSRRVDG
jgi:MFS transporter, SP family, solute carrier family 2 (myo-inositol transporter), member 13